MLAELADESLCLYDTLLCSCMHDASETVSSVNSVDIDINYYGAGFSDCCLHRAL